MRSIAICLSLFCMNLAFGANSEPYFCAVGWYGEFTHISAAKGQIEPTSFLPVTRLQALAWSPDGTLYAGSDTSVYKIDPITGSTSLVCSGFWGVSICGMAFNAAGDLYVVNTHWTTRWESELGKINLNTHTYSKINNFSGSTGWPQGLVFSPQGQLYGISVATGGGHELMTIDEHSAQSISLGIYPNSAYIGQSIEFLPDGSLYALGIKHFAQISPVDGAIIGQVYELDGDYRGLAVIPEPGTLVLLGLGGLMLRKKI